MKKYLESLDFHQIRPVVEAISGPIFLALAWFLVPFSMYKTARDEAVATGLDSALIDAEPCYKPRALKKVNGTDAYRTIGTKRFQSRKDLQKKNFNFSSKSDLLVLQLFGVFFVWLKIWREVFAPRDFANFDTWFNLQNVFCLKWKCIKQAWRQRFPMILIITNRLFHLKRGFS